MIRSLNNSLSLLAIEHKNLISLIFKGINQPITVVKRFGGAYFDKDDNPISNSDAIDSVCECGAKMIIKRATCTGCGNNIKIIDAKPSQSDARKTMDSFGTDFIIQECVNQSSITSALNPTSLNSIRVTSVRDNAGNIHIYSRCIKAGGKGMFVDNIGGGKGGVIIGVNPDGTLKNNGYTYVLDTLTEYNGIVFGNYRISMMERIDAFARTCHNRIPDCKIVGWDIAIDSNDDPILIEANLSWPGITLEQLCTGPIFGDLTEEIIDYVRHNPAI